jgi:hypothetical protein
MRLACNLIQGEAKAAPDFELIQDNDPPLPTLSPPSAWDSVGKIAHSRSAIAMAMAGDFAHPATFT